MSATIKEIFPPIDVALELEPEELAVPLIKYMNVGTKHNLHNTVSAFKGRQIGFRDSSDEYCQPNQYEALAKAVAEAWVWLEREGLIAPFPETGRDWVFITKRGQEFREKGDVQQFKAANLLPKETLDSRLVAKVRPDFLRGDFDSAVFKAFKEVEVRVREKSGFGQEKYGVGLIKEAFRPKDGKLTDKEQLDSERQGVFNLFDGAIRLFKNPASHRDVDFNDPVEVVELIMLANFLIRIVERRTPNEMDTA
jgi:uncharacterized protein (TIGR02391 family)